MKFSKQTSDNFLSHEVQISRRKTIIIIIINITNVTFTITVTIITIINNSYS